MLRLDGKRIEARLERVPEDSPEYSAARAGRRSKFAAATETREAGELDAAGAVVLLGGQLSGRTPNGRLYRAVSRAEGPSPAP